MWADARTGGTRTRFGTQAGHAMRQASVAIAHNLMIAGAVGVLLAGALWGGAPWLIQRARPSQRLCPGQSMPLPTARRAVQGP
jgi:hypothetical protein